MDLVADLAHALHWLSFWIRDLPIDHAQSRNIRTRFSAAHRDQHIRAARQLVGEPLRLGRAQVDPDLLHHGSNSWMHPLGRLSASGEGAAAWLGVEVEECG